MSEFDEIASCLSCSRSEFSTLFDQTRKASGTDSLPFMIIVRSIGPEEPKKALATALKYAYDKYWLEELWDELGAAGFVTDSVPAVLKTKLQQLTGARPGFIDSAIFSSGMLRRQKQICLIEVDKGGAKGTGFLVGPNAVITSGHVIMSLLNEKNEPIEGSHTRIKIKFDHISKAQKPVICTVLKGQWLLDYSPPHASEIEDDDRVTAKGTLTDTSLVDHLDYAILGLATCPGNERGFVDLNKARPAPSKGAKWSIFQHPEAFEQKIASGVFEINRENTNDQRVLYSIDTLPGSSGGLVVDNEFNFVALHQGSIPELKVNNSVINTGIAAEAIRKVVKDVKTPDPSAVLQFRRADNSGPIVGRANCQQWIHKSRVGNPKIIYVHARSGTKGASFSTDIMRACLPESEHSITRVSTHELGLEAFSAAKNLLDKMGIEAGSQLPDPNSAETTSPAWIKASLLPAFKERINQSSDIKLHWLVIDNIDSEPFPDTGVRLFLEALYAEIDTLPRMRIVLIGLKQRPSSVNVSHCQEEIVKAPEPEEIERYICMRYVENEINWDHIGGETNRLARLVDRTSSSDIESLDEHIKQNVDPMIINSAQDD